MSFNLEQSEEEQGLSELIKLELCVTVHIVVQKPYQTGHSLPKDKLKSHLQMPRTHYKLQQLPQIPFAFFYLIFL